MSSARRPRARRARARRALTAAATATGLALAACGGDDAPIFEFAEVERGDVTETVAAPATIQPRNQVTVTAPAPGDVAEVLVDDGDRVEAGRPLVRITSDSIDAQIAQAEAALRAADALSGVGGAGVDISPIFRVTRTQLEAVVPDVLTSLAEAALQVEDPAQRDAALERVDRARENYEASRQALLDAERDAAASADAASAAQAAAAEAQRAQAEAALDAARGQEDELVVTAPVAGVVELARGGGTGAGGLAELGGGSGDDLTGLLGGAGGARAEGPLAAGVSVGPGQALATIYDLGGFHVLADVDEIDVVEVSTGQPATVLVDAFPDATLEGRVGFVAIQPEPGGAGGTVFPVRVDLTAAPEDAPLRVGLTASAEIEVADVTDELVVPSSALLRRGGGEVVFVDDDGSAREVPVEVLAIGEDRAAVDGDLEAGDRVVTIGIESLRDGDDLT